MRAKKEGKCPLCRRNERYSAEYNLYTCPNTKCKLNHFWFSEAEWSRLCRSRPAFEEADHFEQPLEKVTLRDRFAMAALTGLIVAYPDAYRGLAGLAHDAFLAADEMMKERKTAGG